MVHGNLAGRALAEHGLRRRGGWRRCLARVKAGRGVAVAGVAASLESKLAAVRGGGGDACNVGERSGVTGGASEMGACWRTVAFGFCGLAQC